MSRNPEPPGLYPLPPKRPLILIHWLLSLVERGMGRTLWAQRVLAHHPRTLLGAGFLEALVVHADAEVPRRVLKMIRIYVSARVSCPFCLDLNGKDFEKEGLTTVELESLLRRAADPERPPLWPATFTEAEKVALELAEAACSTPVGFTYELRVRAGTFWSQRAQVIVSATAAQVNFWARLIQAFGTSPEGFSDVCERNTFKKEIL